MAYDFLMYDKFVGTKKLYKCPEQLLFNSRSVHPDKYCIYVIKSDGRPQNIFMSDRTDITILFTEFEMDMDIESAILYGHEQPNGERKVIRSFS